MAEFQRILEGERYVTGSLVPVTIYQIRQSYSEAIESDYVEPSVANLARILLEDFDKRYTPADFQRGTLKYYREDVTGSGNRYIGIHQYFFIAAFLDPRVAPMLPEMMTNADFEQLKSDIVDLMSAKAKASKQNKADASPAGTTHIQGSEVASVSNNSHPTPPPPTNTKQAKRATKMNKMFRGLNTQGSTTNSDDDNDGTIYLTCQSDLIRYLTDVNSGACPMENDDHSFNDPLKWWKDNRMKYPYVANISRKFLAIPATSAPSERVWSRAARILSFRRARLKDDLVGRMMFVRENLKFLHKHYYNLKKEETEAHLHPMVEHEMKYLIPFVKDDSEGDVGQNDHLLDF